MHKNVPALTPGRISNVASRSLAARLGLRPGDEVLTINNHPLRDVIDVQFYAADEHLTVRARRNGQEFIRTARRRYGEPLGLDFVRPIFNDLRLCHNRCDFCFISQMPPGLRPSLYVKDDDYRLSFLTGSYITLTNLDEDDWRRIGAQRLSPLYVSVHTTHPTLRRRMLRNERAPDILPQLQRLAELGIEMHTQIVITPGLNDGECLERSVRDLAELYPAVRSVSVVPVGLTKYHHAGCRPLMEAEMRAVFDSVTAWQMRLRQRLGIHFVYLSDEWYLRLGEPLPAVAAYDGLDLTENGVGLGSREWEVGSSPYSLLPTPCSLTIVTGALFAPWLRAATAGFPHITVAPVVNHFFGETVTVAGLLTGRDVIAQLRGKELGEVIALPPAMFGGPEGQSLDEMWPAEIEEALGRRVQVGLSGSSPVGT